jgi:hypothetical protein
VPPTVTLPETAAPAAVGGAAPTPGTPREAVAGGGDEDGPGAAAGGGVPPTVTLPETAAPAAVGGAAPTPGTPGEAVAGGGDEDGPGAARQAPAGAIDEVDPEHAAKSLSYPPAGPGVPPDLGRAVLAQLDGASAAPAAHRVETAMVDDELVWLEPEGEQPEAPYVGRGNHERASDIFDAGHDDGDDADDGSSS